MFQTRLQVLQCKTGNGIQACDIEHIFQAAVAIQMAECPISMITRLRWSFPGFKQGTLLLLFSITVMCTAQKIGG